MKNMDFCISVFHLYGQKFHNKCTADFNETRQNNYIEGVVGATFLVLIFEKNGLFSTFWWKIKLGAEFNKVFQ